MVSQKKGICTGCGYRRGVNWTTGGVRQHDAPQTRQPCSGVGRPARIAADPATEPEAPMAGVSNETIRPRITCPVCGRKVGQRKDGTPFSHNPPPSRPDLACDHSRRGHCRGSHRAEQRAARPSVRGGDPIGHEHELGYREEQDDQ